MPSTFGDAVTERPSAEIRGFPRPDGGRLDLRLEPGETVALVGPNGSGKTSLLRCLAGLPAPLEPRSCAVEGDDPRALPAGDLVDRVAFVTQDPRDGLVGLTVAGEARMRRRVLDRDLAALAERDVATLSSGEARHVALRTALSSPARLLLLDEPMEGLDTEHLRMLRDALRDPGRTVVFVDHDGALADLADRTISLGPSGGHPWQPMPRSDGARRLVAPAHTVRRGERHIPLPAVAFGPGGHAVLGRNGSGKSTLLRHLAGLDGDGPRIDGKPPRPGGDVRLLLPHAREMFLHETIAEELEGCDAAIQQRLVPRVLLTRHPLTLSGGEAQRVSLAKALGHDAAVYLLDEPDAHLDAEGRAALAACLRDRIEAGACVVVATHDVGLAEALGDRITLEDRP